jgi:hypothetical protein
LVLEHRDEMPGRGKGNAVSDILDRVTVTTPSAPGDRDSGILGRGLSVARWVVGAAARVLDGVGSSGVAPADPAVAHVSAELPTPVAPAPRRHAPHVRRPSNDFELEMIGDEAMLLAT